MRGLLESFEFVIADDMAWLRSAPCSGAPITSATIPETIEGSLKRLQTDYIDLYQFVEVRLFLLVDSLFEHLPVVAQTYSSSQPQNSVSAPSNPQPTTNASQQSSNVNQTQTPPQLSTYRRARSIPFHPARTSPRSSTAFASARGI